MIATTTTTKLQIDECSTEIKQYPVIYLKIIYQQFLLFSNELKISRFYLNIQCSIYTKIINYIYSSFDP